MRATAERDSSPDARLIQPRKWANVTHGVARMKPQVLAELMQRKYLKTVGATQSRPHMVPENGSKARRGRESPAFSLRLNTTQNHKFYQSNSVRKRGTQTQKNAFLKTAHADGQVLQLENHKERTPPHEIPELLHECCNQHRYDSRTSYTPNSSTVMSVQMCLLHSSWEGDKKCILTTIIPERKHS